MSSITRKLHTMLHTPRIFWKKFAASPAFRLLPDKTALKIMYKNTYGKALDLKNPKTFNEKLQWLKLNDRKDIYTIMVDKYLAKDYVAEKIGEEYIIPTLGAWDRFEDIDFDSLPEQFVLKCNHGSGDVVICKDKQKLDLDAAKKKMTKALRTDFYKIAREWPYKNVPRKILAEKYMSNGDDTDIADYKFFCFGGKPHYMFVATDRSTDCRFDFFDMDFCHLDLENIHIQADKPIARPENLELMKSLAGKLSEGLSQARIDFYEVNGKVYFGEITLFHAAGFSTFHPETWDRTFGDLIELPK